MLGEQVLVTIAIDVIALSIQLYLMEKNTPVYFDILITIFLAIFNFVSYLNGVIYIAGENQTKINSNVTIITPIYKPDPFAPLFMIGFVFVIVSGFLIIIKIFSKKGVFDFFD